MNAAHLSLDGDFMDWGCVGRECERLLIGLKSSYLSRWSSGVLAGRSEGHYSKVGQARGCEDACKIAAMLRARPWGYVGVIRCFFMALNISTDPRDGPAFHSLTRLVLCL